MGFEDIILPRIAIAEIYKDNLVGIIHQQKKLIEQEPAEAISGKQVLIKFLGKNLKNVVVLVNCPDVIFLPDEELDFLTRILTACKLGIGDIAIINTAKEPVNRATILKLNTKSLLFFGDCISDILENKKVDFFTPFNLDGISIITSPALEKLLIANNESKQLKSKLWVSLQLFFNL